MLVLDILCKVVDNYGDAGLALRLARALSSLEDPPSIRLICDDLDLLSLLAPGIDSEATMQDRFGWKILRWDGIGAGDTGLDGGIAEEYRLRPPRIVIENMACGRPEWLEDLLFGGKGNALIVDLEHLTAEPFAAEFHRLPSLTRSPLVRKTLFFPGFLPGTGGLILDDEFMETLNSSKMEAGRQRLRAAVASELGLSASSRGYFWLFIFGYERDFGRIARDCSSFASEQPLLVFAAAGKSQAPLREAWQGQGRAFNLVCLPFLPQTLWDKLLIASDFSITRGEDSLSRACLSARPFLWQAYPQEGRHQMVKLAAFHELLGRHGSPISLDPFFACNLSLNDRDLDSPSLPGSECLLPCLQSAQSLRPAFHSLSASILSLGNLAANLMTFLREKV